MTTVTFDKLNSDGYTLTTDHSASSYGMPVLVYQNTPHSPDDTINIFHPSSSDGKSAREIVQEQVNIEDPFFACLRTEMNEEQEAMVERFLSA